MKEHPFDVAVGAVAVLVICAVTMIPVAIARWRGVSGRGCLGIGVVSIAMAVNGVGLWLPLALSVMWRKAR